MSPKTRVAFAELSCVTFEPRLKGDLTGSKITYIQISLSKTHVVVINAYFSFLDFVSSKCFNSMKIPLL